MRRQQWTAVDGSGRQRTAGRVNRGGGPMGARDSRDKSLKSRRHLCALSCPRRRPIGSWRAGHKPLSAGLLVSAGVQSIMLWQGGRRPACVHELRASLAVLPSGRRRERAGWECSACPGGATAKSRCSHSAGRAGLAAAAAAAARWATAGGQQTKQLTAMGRPGAGRARWRIYVRSGGRAQAGGWPSMSCLRAPMHVGVGRWRGGRRRAQMGRSGRVEAWRPAAAAAAAADWLGW